MAAPTPSVRVVPTGIMLTDGHQTFFTISLDTNITFWEVTVKPSGAEGGDPIDISTMFNNTTVTKAPQALIDFTNISGECAYDPAVLLEIQSILNVEKSGSTACVGTVEFPDGSTQAQYGYLKTFDPQVLQRGTFPKANFEFVVTNYDPVNRTEELPAVSSVAGT